MSPKVNSSLTIRVHSLERQLYAQEQYLNRTNFRVHLFLLAKKNRISLVLIFFSRKYTVSVDVSERVALLSRHKIDVKEDITLT